MTMLIVVPIIAWALSHVDSAISLPYFASNQWRKTVVQKPVLSTAKTVSTVANGAALCSIRRVRSA